MKPRINYFDIAMTIVTVGLMLFLALWVSGCVAFWKEMGWI